MTLDNYQALREAEEAARSSMDRGGLASEIMEAEDDLAIVNDSGEGWRFRSVINALPLTPNGLLEPHFRRYHYRPWNPLFYDYNDPFNDLVTVFWGPRGGGKTVSAVTSAIIDGQMRGIPVISNVDVAWVAKDLFGNLYKVVTIPFKVDMFIKGDERLKYKRLLIDEGNYLADSMRSTSNKNLAMVDILQQARKFRMCVSFCTINWHWLDPRVTGSLLDILIECNDLYYKGYGRKQGIKKGHRIAWDVRDQSGKVSGRQFHNLASTTFNARAMWKTYDTESFVDPIEARKRLVRNEKTMLDEFGQEVSPTDWFRTLTNKLSKLALVQDEYDSEDLWAALGLHNSPGLRVVAGRHMKGGLGIAKEADKYGHAVYDLSVLR